MADIVKAIDKSGTQYFPITHVNAVRDNNGTTLNVLLNNITPSAVSVSGYTGTTVTTNLTSYDAYGKTTSAATLIYSAVTVSGNLTNVTCPSTIEGATKSGAQANVIYINNGTSSDYTISVTTTYKTPDGKQINLTCPKGGYSEINYLNVGGTIYARGV